MDKAYSINQEDWNYTDASEALQALADDDRMVEGTVYWESDVEVCPPERFLRAGCVLDQASDLIYNAVGECAEDAFVVSEEAVFELGEMLKAWARKHVTGNYWICIGEPRELRVTSADVAEYAP